MFGENVVKRQRGDDTVSGGASVGASALQGCTPDTRTPYTGKAIFTLNARLPHELFCRRP